MAKLVDALRSGRSGVYPRVGSSPSFGTNHSPALDLGSRLTVSRLSVPPFPQTCCENGCPRDIKNIIEEDDNVSFSAYENPGQ